MYFAKHATGARAMTTICRRSGRIALGIVRRQAQRARAASYRIALCALEVSIAVNVRAITPAPPAVPNACERARPQSRWGASL